MCLIIDKNWPWQGQDADLVGSWWGIFSFDYRLWCTDALTVLSHNGKSGLWCLLWFLFCIRAKRLFFVTFYNLNYFPKTRCIENLQRENTMHKLLDSNSLKTSNWTEGLIWAMRFVYQLRQISVVLTPHQRKIFWKQMEATYRNIHTWSKCREFCNYGVPQHICNTA